MDTRLLVTGGKGLLATHLKPLIDGFFIDKEEMDITDIDSIKAAFKRYNPHVVVHLAAFTDVAAAESRKKECWNVNVKATEELAKRSPIFVYMSTEYVFDGEKGYYNESHIPNPVNFYSLTKLMGEKEAEKARRYSIIRTLFKPRPYKHNLVPTDMWTSGDYVDVIARKIAVAIENVHFLPKLVHIGGERKNLYEMALKTNPKAKPVKRASLPIRLPRDTSLDCTLWGMLKYEKQNRKS